MSGKNYRLYVSSTGLAGGTMTEVEYQGDATINTGRTNEVSSFKVGTLTAQGNEGWSASLQMSPVEPLAAGQQLLWTQFINGGSTYIEFKSTTTGSIKHAGAVLVAITEISHPKSGRTMWTVQFNENGVVAMTAV